MAKKGGNPQNLKPFVKGQSGNPSGKSPQLLTKDKVKTILGKFGNMTRDQLQKIVQDPKSTMIEIMVASIMVRAAKDGDYSRLNFILERAIGKVPFETSDTESAPSITITPQNIAELCKAAREQKTEG